jgi:hypothetical protein
MLVFINAKGVNRVDFGSDIGAERNTFVFADWFESHLDRVIAMSRCDCVALVPNTESYTELHEEAGQAGIMVYDAPPIELHVTERKSPKQCKGFMRVIMKMYRVHLRKNADYSPANILGTGRVGLVTRLWDKMARLMNLEGFDLVLAESAEYRGGKESLNESKEDSYWDLAVYAVIGILLYWGVWGK